jgi:type I restriction enzyme R subunit
MSSNFEFIKGDWADLFEGVAKAERNTITDPRTSAFYCRYTLEQAVKWMYQYDSSLRMPYQDKLSALINESSFKNNLGSGLYQRLSYIQRLGNQAVHEGSRIQAHEAMASLKHLFAFFCWLTRTYSSAPPSQMLFKESLIPKQGEGEKSAAQLRKLQEQMAQKDRLLEEERQKQAKYLEELEKLRIQVQSVKTTNRERIPSQDYTESETRELFIDLMLREAGWDMESKFVTTEHPVNNMPGDKKHGKADYVLWGDNGLPLAVIEAKRTTESAEAGRVQARLYAESLEIETGQLSIIFYTNGYETWLWEYHTETGYPPREVQGFYTRDQLQWLISRRTDRKAFKEVPVDQSIVDRYYHFDGIKAVNEHFEERHRKVLVVMATGAGKTQFAIALVKQMMQTGWVRRVLFLADRVALLTQAKRRFNSLYPDASTVNLLEEKEDDTSRVVFSTYPTMMNLIDETRGKEEKLFGVGHFDLIIIDEAHRSIYLKYKTIFDYFDSLLLGLTATPRAEVDRNTYRLFDLEDNVPTYFYELEQAVNDKYLVPLRAIAVPLKFHQEGIIYEELSDEDKEQYEALFYDEVNERMPENIPADALNKWLFNRDTIEKILIHVMQYGIKVQGGDKLGKTIIFAQNQKHAYEIQKHFDRLYPDFKGVFAQPITYKTDHAQQLIDEFSLADKEPTIAISVDMLDTGIDIHEIVNLVFFKIVRSKAKFWQMIGRGTRTCKGLFGPGKDKEHFIIFDFCDNFTYFNHNPEGISASKIEPLTQKIFKKRVLLSNRLNRGELLENKDNVKLHRHLLDILHHDVSSLNVEKYFVRPHRKIVEKFSKRPRWEHLSIVDITDLNEQLASVLRPGDEDEYARRFDLFILNLQTAILENSNLRQPLMERLQELAASLEPLTMVPVVNAQMERIKAVLSDSFRQAPSLWELEQTRLALRDLIKYIERQKRQYVYSDFTDTMRPPEEVYNLIRPDKNFDDYRKKVQSYVREHQDHVTIYRLKHNQRITSVELDELERILFESSGLDDRTELEVVYGTQKPLGRFIRSVVGFDAKAVKDAFARFFYSSDLTFAQRTFINQILDYFIRNGYLEREALFEQPFTDIHYESVVGLFRKEEVDNIIRIIDTINGNVVSF